MDEHCASNLQTAKRIFYYIKGTLNDGIFYDNTDDVKLVRYTDGNWASDVEIRKNTLGYVFHLGLGSIS